MFVVPNCAEYNVALNFKDLNMLQHFQCCYLRIAGCGHLGSGSRAERAQLKDKEHLADLKLTFNSTDERSDDDTLEALQPHSNLKSLEIGWYTATTFSPTWMTTLINLKSLKPSHVT